MTGRLRSLPKALAVGMGALVLSTLGIQAADMLRGVDGSLTGLLSESGGPCGPHAVQILHGSYAFCMDVYEASPGDGCPHEQPSNEIETAENVRVGACAAVSQPEVTPWRFVSLPEAQRLCARAGKRLPNSEEWYAVAASVGDPETCAIDTNTNSPLPTGAAMCESVSGVHDLIGNVWEWMNETVSDGSYENRSLPDSGYVSIVDAAGLVVETSEDPSSDHGADYAWVESEGVRGILRGGFYGSGSDAGIYAQNLSVSPNFKTAGIGFRCVQDM